MRTLLACLLVALCVAAAAAHPGTRVRRYAQPARTMMFSGYFRGHHYPHGGGGFRHYVPRNYEPEGAMTAFAAGNTVSAGSYYGSNGGNGNGGGGGGVAPDCGQCNGNGNGNGHGNGHGYGNGNGNGNGNGHGNAIPAGDEPAPSPPEVIPVNGGGVVPDELPAADAPAYPGDEPDAAGVPEQPATEGPSFDAADPQEPEDAPVPPVNGNGNGKKNGNGNGNGNGKKNGNGNGHANGNGNGNGNGKGNGNGGKTRPRADDDDDYSDEDDDFPVLPGKRGRGGFYNTYFPMIFGGYPGGRSGAAGGETPGVATAIANSFSRGRGAVATSHATAYGGPHLLGGNGSRKAASRRANGSA